MFNRGLRTDLQTVSHRRIRLARVAEGLGFPRPDSISQRPPGPGMAGCHLPRTDLVWQLTGVFCAKPGSRKAGPRTYHGQGRRRSARNGVFFPDRLAI